MAQEDDDIFGADEHISSEEVQWISLADLMTGLMLIFMLIAVAYMMKVEAQTYKVKQVAVLYDRVREEIYNDLMREFKDDLPVWDAEINKDLSIRFRNPDILFGVGEDELKPNFKSILQDFFPRYARIITNSIYEGTIEEVRIEGHTSSVWGPQTPPEEAYFNNMELSQSRTRSTLRFVLSLPEVGGELPWLQKHMTANGLSSAKPILNEQGKEDPDRSQRVEFHIKTDADAWLDTIQESLQ